MQIPPSIFREELSSFLFNIFRSHLNVAFPADQDKFTSTLVCSIVEVKCGLSKI